MKNARPFSRASFLGARWFALALGLGQVILAVRPAEAQPAAPRKRREPPPAVIPTAELGQAEKEFQAGRFAESIVAAKAALNKNERYTPAMLVMAKSFFKLKKYEWVRTIFETMQKNKASANEEAEVYQLLAFMEIEKENFPAAIEFLRKSTAARGDNAAVWNNLGAMFLTAKNFREAVPALEKASQLQPSFAKAFLNLGSAYRGVKEYARAETAYNRALQLFPNYADAVFNLGILYLDADKIENLDLIAQQNKAISFLQRYKQMMATRIAKDDLADTYVAEATDKIDKEQKRIEREQKRLEREAKRGAAKPAEGAAKPAEGAAKPAEGAAKPAEGATK